MKKRDTLNIICILVAAVAIIAAGLYLFLGLTVKNMRVRDSDAYTEETAGSDAGTSADETADEGKATAADVTADINADTAAEETANTDETPAAEETANTDETPDVEETTADGSAANMAFASSDIR